MVRRRFRREGRGGELLPQRPTSDRCGKGVQEYAAESEKVGGRGRLERQRSKGWIEV